MVIDMSSNAIVLAGSANKPAGGRVLVVDDEPLIRWSLAETLSGLGHTVIEAGDARETLQVVSDAVDPPDVVVLDGGRSGRRRDRCRRLLRRSPAERVRLRADGSAGSTRRRAMRAWLLVPLCAACAEPGHFRAAMSFADPP